MYAIRSYYGWKRVVFYPLGAAEALLLDAARPGWKARYFTEPFYLERYLRNNFV